MKKPILLPDGIVIPSSTAFLSHVDQFLEDTMIQAGVDRSIIADVAISVSELVNNAIVHGNRSDLSKSVEVHITVTNAEVRVTVIDQGKGFQPEAVPNPVDDDNLLREVGRGLFIVRNFVDDVTVSSAPTGGTCVAIVKRR